VPTGSLSLAREVPAEDVRLRLDGAVFQSKEQEVGAPHAILSPPQGALPRI
jgi:hypothetical protein